jgi:hypothetical protein
VKIDENRLIQTTRVLNVEVVKLEYLRKTAENLFSMVFETYLYVHLRYYEECCAIHREI